jgi:hypothetical protein
VITKAIGQPKPLRFVAQKIPFGQGESLILASDGMYHVPSFEDRLLSAVQASSLNEGISQLTRKCVDEFANDATIAILRRSDIADIQVYRRCIEYAKDYRVEGLFGHVAARVCCSMMQETIAANDMSASLRLFEYVESHNLMLSRKESIGLLDLIAVHPHRNTPAARELFDRLRRFIRRML